MEPTMFARRQHVLALSRRELCGRAGGGLGWIALSTLLQPSRLLHATTAASATALLPLAPKRSHVPARAKAVIWIFANGGPSQVDTWDYKPELQKRDGKELAGFDPKTGFFPQQVGPLMKSPFAWRQHGRSGTSASALFPHLSRHVDTMSLI